MDAREKYNWSRRELLKLSFLAGGATLIGSKAFAATCFDQTPIGIEVADVGCGVGGEPIPISPFIMYPFNEEMPGSEGNPLNTLRPGYCQYDGTITPNASDAWYVRQCKYGPGISRPGPDASRQDSIGARPRTAGVPGPAVPDAGTHQLWTDGSGVSGVSALKGLGFPLPDPILYHIRLKVSTHQITKSPVMPVDKDGRPVVPPSNVIPVSGKYFLPASTIYGFNGTFPGPRINAEYGKPCLVRFENDLDKNPYCLDRQDFGAPDWAFLTHLHNGHTAPECDGQPHHMTDNGGGYQPGQWVDNLYLNWAAGGDDREKQSFFWFHDHRMHHTGANVYKGMVGLYPIYDPVLDPGDETSNGTTGQALHLPGRRTDYGDGSFDVKYDLPLALYDCVMDDGVTPHSDFHNGCGELHPEWWGKSFFRHYPNHGFVGDIFTVNGVAYPVLNVYRRKYRLRFLDCSVSRIYQLWLMKSSSGPRPAPGTQGQWRLPDGQQCMRFNQVANEGGLLPNPIVRNSFELWPAKRREFVVDFTKYMDGSSTRPGDVMYLVNTLSMQTGRLPDNFPADPNQPKDSQNWVPMVKINIMGNPPEPDLSVNPPANAKLRDMPPPPTAAQQSLLPNRRFELQRGSAQVLIPTDKETEWLINGLQFDQTKPLALPKNGAAEIWTLANGGGGWVHPMHLHMEEHRILSRNGKTAPDALHPDDTGKEDVAALYPSEAVTVYRKFRTFRGNYVAHCHNLAHEDHNMMFGWSIV